MAIDAIARRLRADPGRDFTLAGLMTRKAFLRELRRLSLLLMDVVASRAGHRRAGAKTFTLAQERNLVPVNVRRWIGIAGSRRRIFIQPLAGLIRERSFLRRPCSRMAQSAIIQLPVARKARRVENAHSLFLVRMSRVISDVSIAIAVTLCACDAQLITA